MENNRNQKLNLPKTYPYYQSIYSNIIPLLLITPMLGLAFPLFMFQYWNNMEAGTMLAIFLLVALSLFVLYPLLERFISPKQFVLTQTGITIPASLTKSKIYIDYKDIHTINVYTPSRGFNHSNLVLSITYYNQDSNTLRNKLRLTECVLDKKIGLQLFEDLATLYNMHKRF